VLSAALVRFIDEASTTLAINTLDQERLGLTIDPDTVAWWQQQPHEARTAAQANPVPLVPALQHLATWIAWAGPDPLIWCHGASFDCPILEELYRRAGLEAPWPFASVRDTRTLYDLAGVDVKAYAVPPPHVALNDALAQTRAAKEALRIIAGQRGLV
jgi:hypothetical protein